MRLLKEKSLGLGMDLKLEETLSSSMYLNYGKEVLIQGTFRSSQFKKFIRMFQDTSDAYPSVDNRIVSTCTAAHSCTNKGFEGVIPYLIMIHEIA